MDTPAFRTAKVKMIVRPTIKPLLKPAYLQLRNVAPLRKQFKVPIHGTKANPGKILPDNRIQFIGGRMTRQLLEFPLNNPTLVRIAQLHFNTIDV
jgi:hypothetical protein